MMAMATDSLKEIAEDAYRLASYIRTGNDAELMGDVNLSEMDSEEEAAHREWRIIELIVGLGDRVVMLMGEDARTLIEIPPDVEDMVN